LHKPFPKVAPRARCRWISRTLGHHSIRTERNHRAAPAQILHRGTTKHNRDLGWCGLDTVILVFSSYEQLLDGAGIFCQCAQRAQKVTVPQTTLLDIHWLYLIEHEDLARLHEILGYPPSNILGCFEPARVFWQAGNVGWKLRIWESTTP
jgi:hypothetical protein